MAAVPCAPSQHACDGFSVTVTRQKYGDGYTLQVTSCAQFQSAPSFAAHVGRCAASDPLAGGGAAAALRDDAGAGLARDGRGIRTRRPRGARAPRLHLHPSRLPSANSSFTAQAGCERSTAGCGALDGGSFPRSDRQRATHAHRSRAQAAHQLDAAAAIRISALFRSVAAAVCAGEPCNDAFSRSAAPYDECKRTRQGRPGRAP